MERRTNPSQLPVLALALATLILALLSALSASAEKTSEVSITHCFTQTCWDDGCLKCSRGFFGFGKICQLTNDENGRCSCRTCDTVSLVSRTFNSTCSLFGEYCQGVIVHHYSSPDQAATPGDRAAEFIVPPNLSENEEQ